VSTELSDDPLWFKDAVIYQLHVKAFRDSNADGVGDFKGLTEKLDYLQDLGVTAVWLLPFYPSPLRDDGYDIADYQGVHPDYGTLRQFKRFVQEAHGRGLRVINELVINHTSDQHPWFQRAVKAPKGSQHRDWYVWSDTPDKWDDVRIIFQDFEPSNWTYLAQADQYYWHRFFHHQPDLNFDNAEVRSAVKRALDHWAAMGVDGMRLDAIPYLYEREGTNGENLPETHAFLKELRAHLDSKWSNRMLLAEANQWPEDAAAYFGDDDECHMNFHFPLMPRLFMAIRQEDRFPILDILEQTPDAPENCQWAVFLRNHDELTLEMVTDEERDYMIRAYARDPRMRINLGIRRRLAPLVENDRRQIELLLSLLFAMPGTPVLYYGDEIGMGDNVYLGDRNGVRTPMQWSSDRNAGFSDANPQKLYLPTIIDPEYHYETVNVEAQSNNSRSLLWWVKRLIAMRKRTQVFGRGDISFLTPDNGKVLSFTRSLPPEDDDGRGETVLVVANLSRYVQPVELDLSEFRGLTPIEMFGRTEFPPISERPYFLTLNPYAVYWFSVEEYRPGFTLTPRLDEPPEALPVEHPVVTTAGAWTALLKGKGRERLESALPVILLPRRWFGGKARGIRETTITDVVPVGMGKTDPVLHLLVVHVDYTDGEPEDYLLPVSFAEGVKAERLREEHPRTVLAEVKGQGSKGQSGVLFDGLFDEEAATALLDLIARKRTVKGGGATLSGRRTKLFGSRTEVGQLTPHVLRGEQSNTSIAFGDRYMMKVLRRLEPGRSPDAEVSSYLTEQVGFPHTPPLCGELELTPSNGESRSLAILQSYVPNEGDAWSYTIDALRRFCDRVMTEETQERPGLADAPNVVQLAREGVPDAMADIVGTYLDAAMLLGQRTAELHIALATDTGDKAFAPVEFTTLHQRGLYQSMRNAGRRNLALLRKGAKSLPPEVREVATELVNREADVLSHFKAVSDTRIEAVRTRTHGDYHLGQVLWTGRDFVIIDFEGEPAKPVGERRLKRSPLRDVAGMLRSFDYAAYAALFDQLERGGIADGSEAAAALEAWLRHWALWVGVAFLRSYLATAEGASFLPEDPEHVRTLLEAYLLEKATYELGYELNNRPDWLRIPLQGALGLLNREG